MDCTHYSTTIPDGIISDPLNNNDIDNGNSNSNSIDIETIVYEDEIRSQSLIRFNQCVNTLKYWVLDPLP